MDNNTYHIDKSMQYFYSSTTTDLRKAQANRAIRLIKKDQTKLEKQTKYKKIINTALLSLENVEQGMEGEFSINHYAADEMSRLDDDHITRYIYHRYRYVTYPQNKILDDFPPCLQIELASVCNYKCKFCYQTDFTFSGTKSGYMGTMTKEMFENIIDQAEGNIEFLTLASRGEPLLAKDFNRMIQYTKGKFLSLKLNTNASLMTDDHCHAILSSNVSTLVFSVEASTPELYKEYRVNGNFENIVNNIKRFQQIRNCDYPQSRIITRISGVLYDPQKQKINDVRSFWGKLVDQVSFVNYCPWEKIYTATLNDVSEPCSDLWRRMFIWQDGAIGPCDNDYKSTIFVGSFEDNDISSLWNSQNYVNLRNLHLNNKRINMAPCNRCIVV